MVASRGPDTDELLRRADEGDRSAVDALLDRHRPRLLKLVSIHMDPRTVSRFDPSDVVQDALIEAQRQLPEYLRDRPLSFYPWLRRLAWEQLVRYHRRHIRVQARSVTREVRASFDLYEHSALRLASELVDCATSPSGRFLRAESQRRVRDALRRLAANDREVLVLRFLEGLSQREAGDVLGITEGAVNMRQLRALQRLQRLLDEYGDAQP
jgi:RNA polymerase sigma-70 factor (ECF subfamily)